MLSCRILSSIKVVVGRFPNLVIMIDVSSRSNLHHWLNNCLDLSSGSRVQKCVWDPDPESQSRPAQTKSNSRQDIRFRLQMQLHATPITFPFLATWEDSWLQWKITPKWDHLSIGNSSLLQQTKGIMIHNLLFCRTWLFVSAVLIEINEPFIIRRRRRFEVVSEWHPSISLPFWRSWEDSWL